MKTLKILFAVAIFAGFSTSAVGQNSINANASVLQQISVNGEQDLQFDLVSPGVNKTIDFEGKVSDGTSIGGEQAGRFLVSAGAGSNVTLSYESLPTELTNEASESTMDITYTSAWGESEDGTDATNDITTTEAAESTISTFPTNDLSGENGIYVFLGGTAKPTTDQEAGTYTAEIKLTAEYN